MSAVQNPLLHKPNRQSMQFARMQADDIAEVLEIEYAIYPFPWRRGNFLDSLHSNYETWIVGNATHRLAGYFLLMPAVDDAHLLNITVHANLQGQGIGRMMLDKVVALTQEKGMHFVLLEVRPSNHRALAVYKRYGFSQIGMRKNYYPAAHEMREDAIVMRLPV